MRKVFLLLLGFFPMLLLAQSNSKPNQKNNNNNSQTLIDKTNMKNIEVKQTAGRTALGRRGQYPRKRKALAWSRCRQLVLPSRHRGGR